MSYDSNTPAFPFQPVCEDGTPNEPCMGMDLRDWFAGQALAGMELSRIASNGPLTDGTVRAAYCYADAMLEVRTPKTEGEA